ncbi:hypothetical protein [Flavobacterium fluviatile]|uniref:hypothetical protein n=1 Tax=Flavobacterium fluviatile TaxID=1862387 RepID=UPI0013D6CD70|nr:hypothetical protein [Flavobacterium fluviatile]
MNLLIITTEKRKVELSKMKIPLAIFLLLISFLSFSQEDTKDSSVEEMNKKRQNPVEGLRSIYGQAVLIPDTGDGTFQSYSIQPVWPFRISEDIRLMTYTIIPIQHIPKLSESTGEATGLGNILFNGYFSPVKKRGNVVWGVGPAIQLPTRTESILGSNRVSMGPSALIYLTGEKISGGGVIQNYWSLGGSGANKVNLFNLQYFVYYNFNQGWFALSNASIVSNWLAERNQQWQVPLGGGAGKTFKMGKKFYCGTGQILYNTVKPDYLGNWEFILQLQVIFD